MRLSHIPIGGSLFFSLPVHPLLLFTGFRNASGVLAVPHSETEGLLPLSAAAHHLVCDARETRCAREHLVRKNAVRERTSRARCAKNAVRARSAGVAGRQWRPFSNHRAGGETFHSVGDCHPPLSKFLKPTVCRGGGLPD